MGIDAETVHRHVGGAQHVDQAFVPVHERRQIADHEAGRSVRRTHGAEPQGVRRHIIGAIDFGARKLGNAVDLGDAGADGAACVGRVGMPCAAHIHDRVDDLYVARAAAQDTAQSVHHLGSAGGRIARQEVGRGHQHCRRADAALRRPVALESGL